MERTRSAFRVQSLIASHVSKFQTLLYSQTVRIGLLVELLTSGAEHRADILADARDFAFDAIDVLPLRKFRLWFFSASPATLRTHLIQ